MKLVLKCIIISVLFFNCKDAEKEALKKDPDYADINLDSLNIIKKAINADLKTAKIAQILENKVKLEGFNGTVLVAQKGVVLYKKAFGFANFKTMDTLNVDTKFQLASLSKTFTSVAIMMLQEQGQFHLENTVQDIFPDFPYQGVTIRSLLCHRSGLPNYLYAFDRASRSDTAGMVNNQRLLQWFKIHKPAIYNKPDHFYSYNNTNFFLLAAIVEKASGKAFDVFLREHVFLPLGMTNTFVVTSKDPAFAVNKATGHKNLEEIPFDVFDNVTGDKGVYATVGDLYRWYKGLIKNKLISPESAHEIFMPRSFEYPGYRNYGYGFRLWLDKSFAPEYIYHTGWWKGFNTIMWFDPQSEFVIIMLTNRLNRTVFNVKDLVEVLKDGASTVEADVTEGGESSN
jgi:CubicO group peptidase (beta-lactamase class C family)